MNVITALQVDLDKSPIGTRSRLADDLIGKPVLRRTIDRLSLMAHDSKICVLCPNDQQARCEQLIGDADATVMGVHAPKAAWSDVVTVSRKWSLDGWRGGIGGATCFDEYVDCRVLATLLEAEPADAVLCVPAASPLIDPKLCDQLIAHKQQASEDVRLSFSQALPGLAGIVLDGDLVLELAKGQLPIGWLFAYQPDDPKKDLIFLPTCFELPQDIRYARGRLIVDTQRSFELAEDLIREHDTLDAVSICVWLTEREQTKAESFPQEIEIELTLDDPYPEALLRPRGQRVNSREAMTLSAMQCLSKQLIERDDCLVVLGGFGDPLRHPEFDQMLECLRPRTGNTTGVFGLAIRTAGVNLTDEKIQLLIDHRVDIVNVVLDAWSPDLYGQLQSPGDPTAASLAFVRERIDRLVQKRQEAGIAWPLVVPEITKAKQNVHELDDFYDGWIKHIGAASIVGYTNCAGQCPEHAVMSMAPATRSQCRRLRSRGVVLSDGRWVMCDQDLHGLHAIGNIAETSITDLWHCQQLMTVRMAHRDGEFNCVPICLDCNEWHRP